MRLSVPNFPQILLSGKSSADRVSLWKSHRIGWIDRKGTGFGCLLRNRNHWYDCKHTVIGAELNSDAVKDAIQNAKMNGIRNIRFFCNDATKFMMQMAMTGDTVDVVLMDPPRSGSTEEFIRTVAAVKAKRVVYISCGPETLARDLEIFAKCGYRAQGAWPVDMFAFVDHTECIVKLERVN